MMGPTHKVVATAQNDFRPLRGWQQQQRHQHQHQRHQHQRTSSWLVRRDSLALVWSPLHSTSLDVLGTGPIYFLDIQPPPPPLLSPLPGAARPLLPSSSTPASARHILLQSSDCACACACACACVCAARPCPLHYPGGSLSLHFSLVDPRSASLGLLFSTISATQWASLPAPLLHSSWALRRPLLVTWVRTLGQREALDGLQTVADPKTHRASTEQQTQRGRAPLNTLEPFLDPHHSRQTWPSRDRCP
ncbi:hypothetical protein PMIN07_005352 [Paraphaeosphaeria minitans]